MGELKLAQTAIRSREKLRQQFREGKLDERMVEIDVRERGTPQFGIISNQNLEDMEMSLKDMLPNIFGGGSKKRKMKAADAFDYLVDEEEGRLIDMDSVKTSRQYRPTPANPQSSPENAAGLAVGKHTWRRQPEAESLL